MPIKFKRLKLDYVFDFGMYCGKTIKSTAKIDAHYVLWCHNNIASFTLSESAYEYVYEKYCEQTLVETIEYGDYMMNSLSIY